MLGVLPLSSGYKQSLIFPMDPNRPSVTARTYLPRSCTPDGCPAPTCTPYPVPTASWCHSGCSTQLLACFLPQLPFLNLYVNYVWVGNWVGVLYTCVVYAVLLYGKERLEEPYKRDMTLVREPAVITNSVPCAPGGVGGLAL